MKVFLDQLNICNSHLKNFEIKLYHEKQIPDKKLQTFPFL